MSLGIRNTKERYGAIAIILHWVMVPFIIALFILGVYMRGLPYVDPWYTTGPHLHKSFGIILFVLLVIRTLWQRINPKPKVEGPLWEQIAARIVHTSFYILLFIITLNGYLIPTADGSSIELFNWLEVPAIIQGIEHQEDTAGDLHYRAAILLMILVTLHTLAALKHHFIDKDSTFKKMLGIGKRP